MAPFTKAAKNAVAARKITAASRPGMSLTFQIRRASGYGVTGNRLRQACGRRARGHWAGIPWSKVATPTRSQAPCFAGLAPGTGPVRPCAALNKSSPMPHRSITANTLALHRGHSRYDTWLQLLKTTSFNGFAIRLKKCFRRSARADAKASDAASQIRLWTASAKSCILAANKSGKPIDLTNK